MKLPLGKEKFSSTLLGSSGWPNNCIDMNITENHNLITGFPSGSDGKESTCNAGDLGFDQKGKKVSGGPIPGNPHLFFQIARLFLPFF